MRKASPETRERLLEAGVAAFSDCGYHGTGLKQVLDRVGVPKGSFYNYFDSKEQFAAEVIRHYAARSLACLDVINTQPEADAVAALRCYFSAEIDRCEGKGIGCLLGNLAAELGASQELCRRAMAEAMRASEGRITEAIERGQRAGSIRDDLPASHLASFLFNAWEGALLRMQVEDSVEPLRLCAELVLDSFFRPRSAKAS